MKPRSARKNQPPTGEGKKQSIRAGEPNKLNKRSVVLQSSSAKQNIGSKEEEDAFRSGSATRRAKAGR